MKLLFILHKLQVGGVTSVLLNRLNYLVSNYDYKISILVETEIDNNVKSKFDSKIVIHQIDQNIYKNLTKLPFLSYYILTKKVKKEIVDYLSDFNPDFLIDTGWGYYTLINPYLKNIIKIREYHESYKSRKYVKSYKGLSLFDRFKTIISRSLENKYDVTVALTKKDASHRSYLTKIPKVIPNPITSKDFRIDEKKSKKIVLGVGLLNKRKNFIDQLEIWKKICGKFPDWQLHIYGSDAGEKLNLENAIIKYNLSNSAFLKGQTYDIDTKMKQARILFSTALSEGFGMVIAEAQQMGCAVISYDCYCGPSDIINEGIDGFLVPISDVSYFAEKAELLMSDENLQIEMGSNAIDNSKYFSVEIIAKKWDKLYKSLV